MDKEAQERIEKILDKYAIAFEVDGRYSPAPWAKWIVELLPELGYCKLPKDKPPLIHADGCATNLGVIGAMCNCGAEAQREADIRWYEENK